MSGKKLAEIMDCVALEKKRRVWRACALRRARAAIVRGEIRVTWSGLTIPPLFSKELPEERGA